MATRCAVTIPAERIAEARSHVAMMEVEHAALKRAAALRPIATAPMSIRDLAPQGLQRVRLSTGRGKAAGTLSTQWRTILTEVAKQAGRQPLTPDLWTVIANECGYSLDTRAVRDWLFRGGGATAGYVVREGDAYRVSDMAIERFNLKTAEPPLEEPAAAQ